MQTAGPDAANAYEFFTKQLSLQDYYLYHHKALEEKTSPENNLQELLCWRRLDAAPEVQTKTSLPKKHLEIIEKKSVENNGFIAKKLAALKRNDEVAKSSASFQPYENRQKHVTFQAANTQEGGKSNIQLVKPQLGIDSSLGDTKDLLIETENPPDLTAMWNFIQEAKVAVSTTKIYNLKNHFHRGTYTYSPVFNSNTVGNSNYTPLFKI